MINKRFTMIELLVGIIVIGILASIVVVNIYRFQERNLVSSIKLDSKSVTAAMNTYVKENSDYPTMDSNKPIKGNATVIDVNKLIPKYIKKNNLHKHVKWYLDGELKAYPSFVEIPENIVVEPDKIVIPNLKEKVTYQIVEVNKRGVVVDYLPLAEYFVANNESVTLFTDQIEHNKDTFIGLTIKDERGFTTPPIYYYAPEETEPLRIPHIKVNSDEEIRKFHEVSIRLLNETSVNKIEVAWSEDDEIPKEGWTQINANEPIVKSSISGLRYLHIRVKDIFGRYFYTNTVRKFDNLKPFIYIPENRNPSGEHTILVDVRDDTRLNTVMYTWSNSATIPTNGWLHMPENQTIKRSGNDGLKYLHVKATDVAGNQSHAVSQRVFDNSSPVIYMEEMHKYAKTHEVHVKVTAADSPIRSVLYGWSRNETPPAIMLLMIGTDKKLDLTSYEYLNGLFGPLYLHVKVTDWRGREYAAYTVRYFDGEDPKVRLVDDSTYAKSHSVRLDATDNHRIERMEYAWTTSAYQPRSGWIEARHGEIITKSDGTDEYYLHVRAYDEAKNMDHSYTKRKFDNTQPVLKIDSSSRVQRTHKVDLDISDKDSGVLTAEYQWTYSSTRPETGWESLPSLRSITKSDGVGTMYLHVKVIDRAGNESYRYTARRFN